MPALSGRQDPARPLSLSSRITLGSSSMLIEQAEHSPKHSRAEASALYLSINNRSATRTLFVRPYLAHFCPVFSRFFAVFSVLKPGFQKVAPKDRGPVPQRSKTAAARVVAAVL